MTRQRVSVRKAFGTIPQKLAGPNYQTELDPITKQRASTAQAEKHIWLSETLLGTACCQIQIQIHKQMQIFGSLRRCRAQPVVNKEQKVYLAQVRPHKKIRDYLGIFPNMGGGGLPLIPET